MHRVWRNEQNWPLVRNGSARRQEKPPNQRLGPLGRLGHCDSTRHRSSRPSRPPRRASRPVPVTPRARVMVPQLSDSVRVYRPRCGLPDATALVRRRVADKFSVLTSALTARGLPAEDVQSDHLATVVATMRAFLDRCFGRDAPPREKNLTIFPASLFNDFSPDGALACLLFTAITFARENGLTELDFDDVSKEEDYIALLHAVEKQLKKADHLHIVKAYIAPSISEKELDRYRSILQSHGAAIVSSPDVATHILYPDPSSARENSTDGQVIVRLLDRATHDDEEECLIHWFYHPASYDDWVPRDEVLGRMLPHTATPPPKCWHLHVRWVRDLQLFNEWMTELDYQMPTSFTDFLGPAPPYDAAGVSPPTTPAHIPRIRLRFAARDDASAKVRPTVREVGLPTMPDRGGATIPAPQPQSPSSDSDKPEAEATPAEDVPMADDDPTHVEKIPIAEGVYIPSFSCWFDINAVHDVERRALPEFFLGLYPSKTPAIYLDIRNFMIHSWRSHPKEYLSGTAARRHLAGDACSTLRIHAFLEHWGLINYSSPGDVTPPPSFSRPPRPLPVNEMVENGIDGSKKIQFILDDGSHAEVNNFKMQKNGFVSLYGPPSHGQPPATIPAKPVRDPIEYHCDSCGVDCSAVRFHCATKADVDLCPSCYHNGRYATTMKHRDFIQMNSAVLNGSDDGDPSGWTESETLLLLEALEMYTDNWQLVSEHVGSKGKEQCVIQFLRLPIEDTFLRTTAQKWWLEHPESEGEGELPSPADIMRAAGARESALATISSNMAGAHVRPFSGQPIVCGDQISTIAAFARELSSQTTVEGMASVINSLEAGCRRAHRPFLKELMHILNRQDPKKKALPENISNEVKTSSTDGKDVVITDDRGKESMIIESSVKDDQATDNHVDIGTKVGSIIGTNVKNGDGMEVDSEKPPDFEADVKAKTGSEADANKDTAREPQVNKPNADSIYIKTASCDAMDIEPKEIDDSPANAKTKEVASRRAADCDSKTPPPKTPRDEAGVNGNAAMSDSKEGLAEDYRNDSQSVDNDGDVDNTQTKKSSANDPQDVSMKNAKTKTAIDWKVVVDTQEERCLQSNEQSTEAAKPNMNSDANKADALTGMTKDEDASNSMGEDDGTSVPMTGKVASDSTAKGGVVDIPKTRKQDEKVDANEVADENREALAEEKSIDMVEATPTVRNDLSTTKAFTQVVVVEGDTVKVSIVNKTGEDNHAKDGLAKKSLPDAGNTAANLDEADGRSNDPVEATVGEKRTEAPIGDLAALISSYDSSEVIQKLVLRDGVYRAVRARVRTPAEILAGDDGAALARLCGASKEGVPIHTRAHCGHIQHDPPDERDRAPSTSSERAGAPSAKPGAVGRVALAAATVAAGARASAEDVEIERLGRVIVALRISMVKRKLNHLANIAAAEKKLRRATKRCRDSDMAERISRKRQIISPPEPLDMSSACRTIMDGAVAALHITDGPIAALHVTDLPTTPHEKNSSCWQTWSGNAMNELASKQLPSFEDDKPLGNSLPSHLADENAGSAMDTTTDDAAASTATVPSASGRSSAAATLAPAATPRPPPAQASIPASLSDEGRIATALATAVAAQSIANDDAGNADIGDGSAGNEGDNRTKVGMADASAQAAAASAAAFAAAQVAADAADEAIDTAVTDGIMVDSESGAVQLAACTSAAGLEAVFTGAHNVGDVSDGLQMDGKKSGDVDDVARKVAAATAAAVTAVGLSEASADALHAPP